MVLGHGTRYVVILKLFPPNHNIHYGLGLAVPNYSSQSAGTFRELIENAELRVKICHLTKDVLKDKERMNRLRID